MIEIGNDNGRDDGGQHGPGQDGAARRPEPDAHGQAALLLVESLIHGLISQSTLSVTDAIEVVDIARDIKVEIAETVVERPTTIIESLELLSAIRNSLALDHPTAS